MNISGILDLLQFDHRDAAAVVLVVVRLPRHLYLVLLQDGFDASPLGTVREPLHSRFDSVSKELADDIQNGL
jgi:hypothetical protein